jgi:putative phosphoribosyl transferase
MARRFRDRGDAGRALVDLLSEYAGREDVLVLGLPRGGVPVAAEVARGLGAPLDVFLVRKLGVPGHDELAMGAIASGGVRVINREVVHAAGVSREQMEQAAAREAVELARRAALYRGDRAPPDFSAKTVILVDDGLATGSTMRAAVEALKEQRAGEIVVAVPVAARQTCEELSRHVDAIVCARTPDPFYAVGLWYDDFAQTSDDEVRELLAGGAE